MQQFTVSFPGLGIHDLKIERIALDLELFGMNLEIYWYGVIVALAFLIGLYLSLRDCKKHPKLSQEDVLDAFLLSVPLSVIGARLYYVAFAWHEFSDNPLRILDVREGGMAFYGGVLGGILALLILSKRKNLHPTVFLDFFAPYLALGQGIGRWANFVNQEAFGIRTDLPWGMISDGTVAYLQRIGYPYANSPVHPTFLYESIGNIIIFFLLRKFRRSSRIKGEVSAWYLGMYGALRYFTEGLRTDSLYVGDSDLRISQLLSLLMFTGAYAFLIYSHFKDKRVEEEIENTEE